MELNTEEKILEAAREVFVRKGFAGARMQEIADTAGINKGLLHYYFRSKEKLFQGVFYEAFKHVAPRLTEILEKEIGVLDKIELFVHQYIDILKERPYLPLFVIHELDRDPKGFAQELAKREDLPDPSKFLMELHTAMEAGTIRKIDPIQLIMNIVSMSVFPFVARPILEGVLQVPDMAFQRFIETRKQVVSDFVRHALRPD